MSEREPPSAGATPAEDVRGVVLAGGESVRFEGGDKALARYDGEPLVAHVVSALRAATGVRPVLAARTDDRAARLLDVLPAVPTALDDPAREGPLAGLFGAAEAVASPWLVLAGCDMPLVSERAVDLLLERIDPAADAVVAVREGEPEPLFAAYRTSAILGLRAAVPRRAGPRALVDALAAVRTLPVADAPELARAVTNVNTAAELAALDAADRPDGD